MSHAPRTAQVTLGEDGQAFIATEFANLIEEMDDPKVVVANGDDELTEDECDYLVSIREVDQEIEGVVTCSTMNERGRYSAQVIRRALDGSWEEILKQAGATTRSEVIADGLREFARDGHTWRSVSAIADKYMPEFIATNHLSRELGEIAEDPESEFDAEQWNSNSSSTSVWRVIDRDAEEGQ